MSCRVEVIEAGGAARRIASRATVFAAFENSCYVEAGAHVACLGDTRLGRGPLNVLLEEFPKLAVGDAVGIDFSTSGTWRPTALTATDRFHSVPPQLANAWQDHPQAQAFLRWLAGAGEPDDALIGLGPGLTPAGDDFVGGAMIALRAFGNAALADRIAAWALPLAEKNTNRISRAHLACASEGEGHEVLHQFLGSFEDQHLERLARIGHTSGLDAAAGALLSLETLG